MSAGSYTRHVLIKALGLGAASVTIPGCRSENHEIEQKYQLVHSIFVANAWVIEGLHRRLCYG